MAKVGFHKGSLGSPFQLEYMADRGIDTGPDGDLSEGGPRIGSGVLGKRVMMEVQRDGSSPGRKQPSKRGRGGVEG